MQITKPIESELTRIYLANGERIYPSIVVEEARNKSSPLHELFEWNDKKASEEYRLMQARRLIRVVHITDPTGARSRLVHIPRLEARDGEPSSPGNTREGYYRTLVTVADIPDEFARAMSETLSRLAAVQRALRDLEAAARTAEKDQEVMTGMLVALKALNTAESALRSLH